MQREERLQSKWIGLLKKRQNKTNYPQAVENMRGNARSNRAKMAT